VTPVRAMPEFARVLSYQSTDNLSMTVGIMSVDFRF
jgi:hypothetical protein